MTAIQNDCENLQRQLLMTAFNNCYENEPACICGEIDENLFTTKARIELIRRYNAHIKNLPAVGFFACLRDSVRGIGYLEDELSHIMTYAPLPGWAYFDYVEYLRKLKATLALKELRGL
ncbi:MAG: hypothetical protein LUC34_05065 [Campylobacter sp.]|nr:hypothetical protein [Campylobacter sp.]